MTHHDNGSHKAASDAPAGGPSQPDPRSEFAGNWFWICGASSGIGLAVAAALARKGARLALMSRDARALEARASELRALGSPETLVCALDMTRPETGPEAARQFAACAGSRPLSGLLLNQGGPHGGKVTTLGWEEYEAANRLLLQGPVCLLSHLAPRLVSPGGSVVTITSTTTVQPNPDLPLSAAYRTGLVALLKHWSDELGPKGIRLNNVAPGYTRTDRLTELKTHVATRVHGQADESALARTEEEWANRSALKRIAEPDEVAQACLFLFSSAASFITGQTLIVDGGQVRRY